MERGWSTTVGDDEKVAVAHLEKGSSSGAMVRGGMDIYQPINLFI